MWRVLWRDGTTDVSHGSMTDAMCEIFAHDAERNLLLSPWALCVNGIKSGKSGEAAGEFLL
jgi:hypothetical protein